MSGVEGRTAREHLPLGADGARAGDPLGIPAGPSPPRPRVDWGLRWATAGIGATIAAAMSYVLAFNPTDRRPDPTGPCTWHVLFGTNGPACGITRMLWYLLHGNLVEAARHHLLALIGLPVGLYALAAWTLTVWFGWRLPPIRLSRWVYLGYAVAFVLYAVVLRNLPWPPFSWFDIPNLT